MFRAIVFKKNAKMKDSYPLNVNDLTINSENSLKLLGIKIDKKLSFEQHIFTLFNKASNQVNATGRLQKYPVLRKTKFFLILLFTHTLIIVLLLGIFAYLNR